MRSQVDIFFDTTVLVAASEQSHPHYTQARSALLRVAAGRDKGFMGLHSIAEVFAALTRLPVQPRIHPVEAAHVVTDNILPHFEVVSLGKEGYLEVIGRYFAATTSKTDGSAPPRPWSEQRPEDKKGSPSTLGPLGPTVVRGVGRGACR